MLKQIISRFTVVFLFALMLSACGEGGSSSSDSNAGVGRGGSTARMVVVGDYLYAIAENNLQLFDVSEPSSPTPYVRVSVGWGIETLFPYGNYLLIGADNGMHIMDNTDPTQPVKVGEFAHARAQDPVVAENGFAYVTLRDGGNWGEFTNQMEVIDISDVTTPVLIDTLAMQRPYGLSIENNRLYVCDDIAGIKAFNTEDPANLVLIETIQDVVCNDVILQGDRLFAITSDQLIQYDVSTSPATRLSGLTEALL